MAKRKKNSQKENRVATKVSCGKITKAKHKETPMETVSTKKMQVRLVRTPLVQRQSANLPKELISATHYLQKSPPKWTSTPLNTATAKNPEDNTFRFGRLIRKNLKYNTFATPDRPPLSPILWKNNNSIELGENENKENASLLPTKRKINLRLSLRAQESRKRTSSESQNCSKSNAASTLSERDPIRTNAERITRRRSTGIPKTTKINDFLEEPSKYKTNRCSNLRVRLSRCSSISDDVSAAVIPITNNRRRSVLFDPKNASFVQRLRDDWSTTSLHDTHSQIEQITDKIIPLRAEKRQLSPLIELSSYECSLSTAKPLATTSVNEDAYSSSAEFESSDENENRRSKRAPTWKDLSSKSIKSASHKTNQVSQNLNDLHKSRSLKVRVRKLRIHTAAGNSVSTNKDPEVISKTKTNDKVPSKNLGAVIVTSKEVPSQETNEQQADRNNPSDEPAAKEYIMPPPPKSHNLLNKSDLIEEILSSFTDEDVQHVSTTDKTNSNCTRKFFHSPRNHNMAVPKTVEPLKRNKKRESIYEFLSQSSSDSNDPVADVIQKMINNGKVVVAKHKKGTGKSVVPRRKRKVAAKKKLPEADEVFVNPNPTLFPAKTQPPPVEAKSIYNGSSFPQGSAPQVDEEPVRDQRGFSKLARSAMIKHAGKRDTILHRKMITDKQQLLAMAQKFVGQSTPVRRVSLPPTSNATAPFSPIPGGSSPWRVDDDKLPNTFYFDRNSDNLPSYSSDYIPSTPSKNKSKSTSSSFSSNDSNGENVAPPSAPSAENHAQITLNPRRALSYRSPLKAINILEVVNLPSLAMERKEKDTPKETPNRNILNKSAGPLSKSENHAQITPNPRRPLSYRSPLKATNILEVVNLPPLAVEGQEKDPSKETPNSNKLNKSGGDVSKANVSNLFGFEEMIEDDEGDVEITHQVLNAGKINLKEQMQRLKRLRYEIPKATPSRDNRIKPVFDNERQRQKTLQQMFSSTMIERPSLEPHNPHNSTVDTNNLNGTGDSNLFKDPETTFDQSSARRSYSRPFKRKRKLRHNFVMFMDSDESEEESDDAAGKKKKKLKERNKKTPQENLELNNFVKDFNAMYKEVSEYELIVE